MKSKRSARFIQRGLLWTLATIAVIAIKSPAGATYRNRTLHVANNGQDIANCGVRPNPCRSISRAISNAQPGDLIVVGPGRYGDLNGDGVLSGPGEEAGEIVSGCECIVNVHKRLTILSTDGASATVVDAGFGTLGGSSFVAVRITADGVSFGRLGHGFTLTGSQGNSGLAIAGSTSGVSVAGNLASNNAQGFTVFGTGHTIKHNLAVTNDGAGFDVNGTGHTVERNISSGNGDGFVVGNIGDGNHLLIENASGGNLVGYTVLGSARLVYSSALGNRDAGIRVEPGARVTILRSNIFGNDEDTVGVFGQTNCGLLNRSGQAVEALNNYWGAASGPGSNPADAACAISGAINAMPFSEKAFRIDAASGPYLDRLP